MKFTGASLAIELLERQGIEIVAGIPGGANLPLYHALGRSSIRHILVRHEQAAGFLAHGIARTTGRVGVCFATSGPGATNLLTAIADAKLDSVPLVAITGQVPTSLIGTDAFQEVDTYGLTVPITKHNFLVRSAGELLRVVPEAFRIAASGRKGPVVIDIPKDVQIAEIEVEELPPPGLPDEHPLILPAVLAKVARLIAGAQRPLLYIGGGVIAADAAAEVRSLAARCDLPAVTTLMGLGALPAGDPHLIGMLGMHGERSTNAVVDRADLLIALGARFDDRATGDPRSFAKDAAVVHLDIDASEIGKIRRPEAALACDLKEALSRLSSMLPREERATWRAEVEEIRRSLPPLAFDDPAHPARLLRALAAMVSEDAIVTTDVGQHQMWAAQWWPVARPRSFLTSGGLGTMGFGVPAAIGAALAHPDRTVVAITGDGSLLMNIQELATVAELGLDIKICVLNNGHLGLVRQQQELFYDRRFIGSRFEVRPDFAAIAAGFGIRAASFGLSPRYDEIAGALSMSGPALLDLAIPEQENVYPMVPPGRANADAIIGEVVVR